MKMHPDFPYPLYLVISEKDCLHFPYLQVLEEAILGGVDIVQLREKKCSYPDFLAKAIAVKSITDHYNIPLIINDSAAVAREINGFGIHVGNQDTPPSELRKLLGQDINIGYSIEYLEQLDSEESEIANCLAVSPVFRTPTKTNTVTEWGLEGLTKISKKTKKPIIAIGNMHFNNIKSVIKAGANSVAVVSEICASKNPRESAQLLKKNMI